MDSRENHANPHRTRSRTAAADAFFAELTPLRNTPARGEPEGNAPARAAPGGSFEDLQALRLASLENKFDALLTSLGVACDAA